MSFLIFPPENNLFFYTTNNIFFEQNVKIFFGQFLFFCMSYDSFCLFVRFTTKIFFMSPNG